jgi:hypothetical protein
LGSDSAAELRRFSCAASIALLAVLAAPSAAADEAAAQRAYATGLERARAGELEAARAAFEDAYRESPHYLVLYNLARVCRDLGELDAAGGYLERYLREGGARIPPAERQAAEREVAEIRSERAERERAKTGAAPASNAVEPPLGPAERAPPLVPEAALVRRSGEPGASRAKRPTPAKPSSSQPSREVAINRARWSGFSLALASAGGLVIGVSSAVLIWDRYRYEDWSSEDRELAALGPVTVVAGDDGSSLAAARAQQQRVDRNNALADSIQHTDRAAWIGVSAGALLVVTAATIWLTAGERPAFLARKNGADLRFSF